MGEPVDGSPIGTLCQTHPTDKVTLIKHGGSSCLPDELMNEPLKVPLEYTLTPNPVLLKNSIQAGLGGIRLPTTIKQSDETITNLCNLVAVKIYTGDAIALLILYTSVVHCPILTISDGSVHQGFNLTHWWGCLV